MSGSRWRGRRCRAFPHTARRRIQKRTRGEADRPFIVEGGVRDWNFQVESANQNFAPVLVLLSLIVGFLYLHFTGSSGRSRLYLAAVLTVVAVVLLLPSANFALPEQLKSWMPGAKIQLGLDLQGGTHLLMSVKLEDAVKTQLKRRGDDLKKELKDNKIDADITQDATGDLVVSIKNSADASAFNDIVAKSYPDLSIASGSTESGAPAYIVKFKPMQVSQIESNAMDQALETIRNRIDQLGV